MQITQCIFKTTAAIAIGLISVLLVAQRSQAPITNADVLKMVKAGTPEVEIVKAMQSRSAKFDLSPEALLALQREGAGQNVLKAMEIKSQTDGGMADGSRQVRRAGELPAVQPGPANPGQKIVNPRATHLGDVTIATLQKQKSVADVEAAQMNVSVRPQMQGGTIIGQSQTMSATGANRTTQTVQAHATTVAANTVTKPVSQSTKGAATLAPTAVVQRAPSAVNVAPGQTQVATGNAPMLRASATPLLMQAPASNSGSGGQPQAGTAGPSNQGGSGSPSGQLQMVSGGPSSQPQVNAGNSTGGSGVSTSNSRLASMEQLHKFDSSALVCAQNPQFRILNVSGSSFPATFTPIDQYNLYTITGCSFGNANPNNKVYIYGTGKFQGNFNIKFWSDNSIALSLDESISGFPDLDNLTLVVQRSDGQQTQKSGFKFYAARQTVELKTIPTPWVTLATLTSGFKTLNPEYSSPPTSDDGGPGPGAGSAYVSRFFYGQKFDPSGRYDHFYFKNLAPGWTTDSFQMFTYDLSCPYTVTWRQNFGTWSSGWDGDNIYVGLSDTSCSGFNPASMILGIPLNIYQNRTGSYYTLKVWVSGPRGLDPLTNNRAQ